MGDHRASIQIDFEMHGVKKQMDFWINWYSADGEIDKRILDFFEEAVEEAMQAYDKDQMEYRLEQQQLEQQKENIEKSEYERLKKIYDR